MSIFSSPSCRKFIIFLEFGEKFENLAVAPSQIVPYKIKVVSHISADCTAVLFLYLNSNFKCTVFLLHILAEILFKISFYFMILLEFGAWLIKGEIIHVSKLTEKYQSHHILAQ